MGSGRDGDGRRKCRMHSVPSLDFRRAEFTVAAQKIRQLPEDSGSEVAFAGRSNAGKSSSLNAIAGRNALARVSKTPGRTQQLVVFELEPGIRLVDLPGYGYAKVPTAMKAVWEQTMDEYFRTRKSLSGLVLIMDVRHPLRDFDRQMLEFCAVAAIPVHILLNKADKLKRGAASSTLLAVGRELNKAELGEVSVQLFSALRSTGVQDAREIISRWLTEQETGDE